MRTHAKRACSASARATEENVFVAHIDPADVHASLGVGKGVELLRGELGHVGDCFIGAVDQREHLVLRTVGQLDAERAARADDSHCVGARHDQLRARQRDEASRHAVRHEAVVVPLANLGEGQWLRRQKLLGREARVRAGDGDQHWRRLIRQ
eukprot:6175600-Pleurochrysis_carterae.AAC.2